MKTETPTVAGPQAPAVGARLGTAAHPIGATRRRATTLVMISAGPGRRTGHAGTWYVGSDSKPAFVGSVGSFVCDPSARRHLDRSP